MMQGSGMEQIGRMLIVLAIFLGIIGLFMIFGSRIPFVGKPPGDIRIEGKSFTFYLPVVTCIALSLIASAIMYLLRRL
jgi:Protein of unknown function (DUF2905)